MNMVRIRHILEMRRACKAPPLLPPKSRREGSDPTGRNVKDVLDLSFRISILAPERFTAQFYHVNIYESQDSVDGPWNLVSETDRLSIDDVAVLEDLFAIEFSFERVQWFRVEIIEAPDSGAKLVRTTDVFSIAQVCQSTVTLQLTNPSGYHMCDVEIWSQVRERSQPIMLQLEAKNISNKVVSPNSNLYLEIYKVDQQKRLLYRSEPSKQTRLTWRPFSTQSDDFFGCDGENSQIEICCVSEEDREGVIGQAIISTETVKSMEAIPMFNETYKQGRKPIGEIRVIRCQQLRVCSFLDYIRSGTQLRFAVAIDFSVRDPQSLTQDDYLRYQNDIEFVVRCLGETLEPFNSTNSFLSYGFGAKIPPHYRDSNNFCLSLDVEASCQGVNGVLGAFAKSHQRVQPLASAKFAQIIYHLAKQSQNAFNREPSNANYFVLFVITRGSMEDLKETVQAAIFASKAPISIVFVGVGCEGLEEIERIGSAGKRLEFQGRKSERDNLQFVNATKTRLECDNYSDMVSSLMDKALQQIPWQCSTFFMQNHVFPGRSSENGQGLMAQSVSRRPSSAVNGDGENEEMRMRTSSSGEQTSSRRHRLSTELRSLTLDDSR
uniref:Copine domain-containing protein n=1 Tax=Caenorhabditis japonica TaxID=281687 RepID=A0A8R1I5W4_CAEJA